MSRRALLMNLTTGYVGTFALLALGILTKMLLSRLLAPSQMGVVISAQTIFGLAVFVASLGLSDAVIRFVAMDTGRGGTAVRSVLTVAFRLMLPATAIVTVVVGLASTSIGLRAAPGHPEFVSVLTIFVLAIPAKAVADQLGAAFQGVGRYWVKVAAVDLLPAAIVALTFVAFVIRGHSAPVPVALVYLGSVAIGAGILAVAGQRTFPHQDAANTPSPRELTRFGLPLLASGIVAWPMALVPVFIGGLISTESVAYYGFAMSLASFIYLGTSVAEAASFGVWAAYLGADLRERLVENYRLVTRWGLLVASVVFVPLFFCATEVVRIVYGPEYLGTAEVLPLFALTYFANVATGPNESILKTLGRTPWILATRLAVGLSILVSLYPLVRAFGLWGATASYALTTLVAILMYAGFLFKVHRIHPFDGAFLRVAAALAVALLAVELSTAWISARSSGFATILLHLAAFVLVVAVLLPAFGAIGPTERDLVNRLRARLTLVPS